jgi:hypothetical protein
MAGERNFDYGEVPNKYKLFTDRVNVLNRKVMVEKTEIVNLALGSDDYIFTFLQHENMHRNAIDRAFNVREELEKSRVFTEKDINLIKNHIQTLENHTEKKKNIKRFVLKC